MLRFKDSNGEVIAVLNDDDSEPEFIEDKKKKSKKRIKADLGVYQPPLVSTDNKSPEDSKE